MIGTLEQMIENMEQGVFNFTDDGHCSNCGQCCSDVLPVSEKEIHTIKGYIRKNNINEQRHFVPLAKPYYDMTCPFRNNTVRKCMIYPVRPMICRDFQCDKPQKHIEADKRMYHRKNHVISMRSTFFGKEETHNG